MSVQAAILHDELDEVSLVYLDDRLTYVLPWDASWEAHLGELLGAVATADEYLLADGYRGLRAGHLRDVPARALAPLPVDYGWSAEALGDMLGLAIVWTMVTGADFIFGPEWDPFGLF